MKLGIESALSASFSFILCLLTRGPNCSKNTIETEENYIPDDNAIYVSRPRFPVYWNVPTFQCHKYGLNFSRVSTWGISQNPNDEFRGDVVSILYDPGEFPALLEAPALGNVPRNGGVPQEGSLSQHLQNFKSHVEKLIPWKNYEGLGILDFEHWRPIWHQNWGSLNMYRTFSKMIERRRHPFWFPSMLEKEAVYRYELSAKMFLLETLKMAKYLRPNAKWGYYGYPFCFNYTPHNNKETCSDQVQEDNDRMDWLFSETTGYYPSLYIKERDMGTLTRRRFVRGRVTEALRIAKDAPVYPYVWYKYHDSNRFLSAEDMFDVIGTPREKGCEGVVIWGASNDVNTEAKCRALEDYLENVLGPAVAQVNAGVLVENIETTVVPTEMPTTTEETRHDTTLQPEIMTYSPIIEEEEEEIDEDEEMEEITTKEPVKEPEDEEEDEEMEEIITKEPIKEPEDEEEEEMEEIITETTVKEPEDEEEEEEEEEEDEYGEGYIKTKYNATPIIKIQNFIRTRINSKFKRT